MAEQLSTGREPRSEPEATLETLTEAQREAVYRWLALEVDYGDLLASWVWEHAWLPEPGTDRR